MLDIQSRDICEAHIDWHQSQWKYKLLLAGDVSRWARCRLGEKLRLFRFWCIKTTHRRCTTYKSTMGNFDQNAFLKITSPRDFNLKHAATKKMLPSIVAGGSSNVKNRMIEIEVERAIPQNLEAITGQNG